MIDIGQRIKKRRKELGLSAETVAAQVGISAATMYRYEKNEIANMGTDKLEPIAIALSTTPAYLMGWTDNPDLQTDWSISDDTRNKLQSIFGGSQGIDNLSPDALSFAQDFDDLDDWGRSFIQSVMQMVMIEHRKH